MTGGNAGGASGYGRAAVDGPAPVTDNGRVRYGILGTTQALRDDGTAVAVGGARLRALLAVLALRTGRTVPFAVLVDEVWDGDPPADASGALQALVGLPDGRSAMRRSCPRTTATGWPPNRTASTSTVSNASRGGRAGPGGRMIRRRP